jgi:4a-hydroxytetrahydrobiopterin dehydratase
MTDLTHKKCIPCSTSTPPLKGPELLKLLSSLTDWKLNSDHHLEKEYIFKNFKEALAFTNVIGSIAEQEGHHPDLFLTWGKVKVVLWTHKIHGLSENDFILAAKIDAAKK